MSSKDENENLKEEKENENENENEYENKNENEDDDDIIKILMHSNEYLYIKKRSPANNVGLKASKELQLFNQLIVLLL